jgi:hypothetical protein
LFQDQFHIAFENCREKNYFTEKLMDCFITKTIPIYYGCPNIEEFFDIEGMIVVGSAEECISACNNLDHSYYMSRIKHVNNNFQKCKQYVKDFTTRIYEAINFNLYGK